MCDASGVVAVLTPIKVSSSNKESTNLKFFEILISFCAGQQQQVAAAQRAACIVPSVIVHINRPNVSGPASISGQAPNAVPSFTQVTSSSPSSRSVIAPVSATAPSAPTIDHQHVGWQLDTISLEISNS